MLRTQWQCYSLVALPLALFLLFIFAGAWVYPVFLYDAGASGVFQGSGGRYFIGAQGYHIDALSNAPTFGGFQYEPPANWPFSVSQLPTILLVHFVLAILLFAHLLLLGGLYKFQKRDRHNFAHELILHPFGVASSFAMALFTLAVSSVDAWVCVECRNRTINLTPEPLGYAVMIVGMVLAVGWLLLQVWAKVTHRASVRGRKKRDAEQSSRSRSSSSKRRK